MRDKYANTIMASIWLGYIYTKTDKDTKQEIIPGIIGSDKIQVFYCVP